MFSDSSYDSDDVAVIRRSILDPSGEIPFIQSLSEFAKQACGWSGSLKKFLYAQPHGSSFAAIAACPPVAVTVKVLQLFCDDASQLPHTCQATQFSNSAAQHLLWYTLLFVYHVVLFFG